MRHVFSDIRSRVVLSVVVHALAAGPVSADWPAFGRAITQAPNSQAHSAIATDGAGGAIVTWQDSRAPRLNIFAQHVLGSGELDAAWPVNGRALLRDSLALVNAPGGQFAPAIVADGSGGAIVAWQDLRIGANDFDLYAQHILGSGVTDPAWPANGTALVATEGRQGTHAIASDGAGGAFVTWMDSRPGATIADIYAQHVLASGAVDARWPANGLAIGVAPGLQEFPVIVEDGSGGAIIGWDDGRSATTGFDVYAQHVLASGTVDPAWPVNGRVLCAATGDQGRATIAADDANGAIVAWTDARNVQTDHIFAQHVLGSGLVDPAWPANGSAVSDAGVLESRPLAVSDGAGGAVVTWQAFTVHLNMYAQHVTALGVVDPEWPAGGRALSLTDRNQDHGAIASDGAGGAIVAWDDSFEVVAQHVLASGALDSSYPDTGRSVSRLPSQGGEPAIVTTGGSGAIVSWTDGRNGPSSGIDIFALQVLEAGTSGVPDTSPPRITFARPHPNPSRDAVTLRYALPRGAGVRLSIYDVAGRRVRDLVSGVTPAGAHATTWDLRDDAGQRVGAGLYFARLETEGRTFTEKLTALR